VLFVVWTSYSRRASELGKHAGCDLLFVNHLIKSRGLLWKIFNPVDYLYKSLYTLIVLSIKHPKIVFAQSPPSICANVCFLYCFLFKRKLVIDAHNGSFRKRWISVPFFITVMQRADVVLVHNDELEKSLRDSYHNINFFNLPDKIPELSVQEEPAEKSKCDYLLVVLAYNYDEPVKEILMALDAFSNENKSGVSFQLTGNYKKEIELYEKYSKNSSINFTGYVSNAEYERLLMNASGVIAITTQPMLQQCALIEALGAGIPVITSETETNKRIFFKGGVFASPDSTSIKKAIINFLENKNKLKEEISELRNYWVKDWHKKYERLVDQLTGITLK